MDEERSGWWAFDAPTPAAPTSAWSPSFARLVRLMIDGPGEADHLRGQVLARVEDRPVTFRYGISRREDLIRCEDPDGRIYFIAGRDTVWLCDLFSGQLIVRARPRGASPAPDDFDFGCARPSEDRWAGNDFTVPTGPEVATEFVGRKAWMVELAPPPHKPFPMQMVIDASTGLILRNGNEAFGTFHQWTELDTNADLPDELFSFDPDIDALAEPRACR